MLRLKRSTWQLILKVLIAVASTILGAFGVHKASGDGPDDNPPLAPTAVVALPPEEQLSTRIS